MLSKEGRE